MEEVTVYADSPLAQYLEGGLRYFQDTSNMYTE